MQNKANFRKSQVNVNLYNTTDYENKSDWTPGENKPNSNPIKANFKGDDGFSTHSAALYKRRCLTSDFYLQNVLTGNSCPHGIYKNRWERRSLSPR